MSVRRQRSEKDGLYFITFTCYNWLPLIDIVNGYDLVYKQFNYLKSCRHYIVGYIIMPNHIHALIAFKNTGKTINSIVGNIKRFMAYDIVERLEQRGRKDILQKLADGVNATDKKKGQLHQVFEPSFDGKWCYSEKIVYQKLDYMHMNPCRGKWKLCDCPEEYLHSSAHFYITGVQGIYEVLNYLELMDIDLTGGIREM